MDPIQYNMLERAGIKNHTLPILLSYCKKMDELAIHDNVYHFD